MMMVSISLFLLFARPPAEPMFQPQQAPPSLFAYVREDGSEVYLQHTGSALPRPEIAELKAAVYSWSSPVTSD